MPESIVNIIIVKYGLPDLEKQCIEQVKKVTKIPYRLTVYDNYDKDENLSVVWNRLIDETKEQYVCLLNNDTIPHRGWLEKLMEVFVDFNQVGAVGPISNVAGGPQGGFTKAIDKQIVVSHTLSGFCTVFPKKVWDIVGGFDEGYKLYGEDSDFFNRVKKAGLGLFIRYDTFVYHYGRQSTQIAKERGKDIEAIKKESAARYQRSL